MRAGELRHRVDVETLVIGKDAAAGETHTPSVFRAAVPCSIEPLQGREIALAREVHAETTHRVVMRWFAGLLVTMRLKLGSRTFDILSIVNVEERNRTYQLLVKEGVSQGS